MQPKLVLHDATRSQLEALRQEPAHALLLVGSDGIGKTAVALELGRQLLGMSPEKPFDATTGGKMISPDEKQTISIDTVRELQNFLRLKTTGQARIRRVVIIEHADCLTSEAQNAFLKILEEPPKDTIICLTVDSPHSLLPTIRSRTQQFIVREPAKEALLAHFSGADTAAVTQAYFLSGGLPGLMTALLENNEQHPLLQSVGQAKELLQKDAFERLIAVESIGKQKNDALRLCQALQRIAQAGLAQAAIKQEQPRMLQWHRILKSAAQAQELLKQNVNTKLTLTHLVLQLS